MFRELELEVLRKLDDRDSRQNVELDPAAKEHSPSEPDNALSTPSLFHRETDDITLKW